MSGSEVERTILEVLTKIQAMSGQPCPAIDGHTCPLRDLPQFDSQLALLATVELATRLNCEIPEDVNIFVDDKGDQPCRIGEITEKICAMLTPRATNHGR
jgi:hypothetical protein